MNDERIMEYLSRSIDGDLDAAEQQILDNAPSRSASLRAMKQELIEMRDLMAQPAPECPPELAGTLQQQVDERYQRRRFRLIQARSPVMVLAAAALLLLSFGAGWYLSRSAVPVTVPEPDSKRTVAEVDPLDEVRRAIQKTQQDYYVAIQRLEEQATARLIQMPPDLALGYAENLRIIDQAIRDCEKLARLYPDNSFNYRTLAQAYQSRIDLLEKILET